MSSEPRWISRKALLLLHEESLAEFGGARGLRDEGLLDSALTRPRNTYLYNDAATSAELAASYCYGIAKNHAFVGKFNRCSTRLRTFATWHVRVQRQLLFLRVAPSDGGSQSSICRV